MVEPGVPTSGDPAAGRFRELRALLEITALCGMVITQPLLNVTGKSPDFFLYYGAERSDILLLVALVTLTPPLLLWGIGRLFGFLGRRLRRWMHTLTVAVLLAALAVQIGKYLSPVRGVPLMVIAMLVAGAASYVYQRWQAPAQLLRFAAVGPAVFVLLFVFASPVSALVVTGERGGAGAGSARGGNTYPPVVLVVLDELPLVSLLGPDGRIDDQRFPNFARFAADATWYRNSTAVSGRTPYALPAMLTGHYPRGELAPHYSQYPDNLFTLLGDYEIRAQESITQLCPPRQCEVRRDRAALPELLRESGTLLRQIVSTRSEPARDPTAAYREETQREAHHSQPESTDSQFRWGALDENQPVRFAQFLAGLQPANRPTLHFLHLLMPHTPWTYLPSGLRYDAPPDLFNDGDGWVSLARDRHLAQLGYTDRLIGETLRALESSGLYDDAVVAVTADHGLSFTPGAQGRGADSVRIAPAEVLWVPTFIKAPGQTAGLIDDRNWQQIDLLPTIADLVGVEVPWRSDGVSALRTARASAEKQFHNQPGTSLTLSAEQSFAAVTSGAATPALPPPLLPELLGRDPVEVLAPGTGLVTVGNFAAFSGVDPSSGRVPALVHGTVPDSVRSGARLAVAVNGRIAAVVPVVDPDRGGRRFAGLIHDEALLRPGVNELEIFEITDDVKLRQLQIQQ